MCDEEPSSGCAENGFPFRGVAGTWSAGTPVWVTVCTLIKRLSYGLTRSSRLLLAIRTPIKCLSYGLSLLRVSPSCRSQYTAKMASDLGCEGSARFVCGLLRFIEKGKPSKVGLRSNPCYDACFL